MAALIGYLASHKDHRRHSAVRVTQQRVTGSKDRVGKSHCTKLSQDPDILLFRNILRFQIYILLRCLSLLSVAGTHYLTYPIMPNQHSQVLLWMATMLPTTNIPTPRIYWASAKPPDRSLSELARQSPGIKLPITVSRPRKIRR